ATVGVGVEPRAPGLRVAPADARRVAPRAVGREVGDADEVNARLARDLGQVHRAELAGADQADADRPVLGFAPLQLRVEAHAASFSSWVEVSSALGGMPSFHGRSTG